MRAQTPPDPQTRQHPGQHPSAPPAPSQWDQRPNPPTRIPSGAHGRAPSYNNAQRDSLHDSEHDFWRDVQPRQKSYWPILSALSLVGALLALLAFLMLTHGELAVATSDLRLDPRSLSLREVALLVLCASIPLATGLF